jgi:hypothetical protein
LVVTFAALALAMPVMVWSGARPLTPQDDVWAVALWVVVIGSPAVGTAFYLLHCRIVADARGLWIYGWHPRLGIAWEAIQDYELRFPTSNQGGAHDGSGTGASRAYIQSGGKWHHLSDLYLPRQPLLDTIACHAKWAKATGWHLAEIREDGDWPKIFEYHDESGWKLVGMYLGMSFGLSAQIWIDGLFKGFGPMLAGVAEIWRFLSPWGRVGFALMPVVTCGSLPLIFLTRYPAIVTRRRYLGQQMKATREGIALFRNSRQTFFRWEEIESYHLEALPGSFQPTRCVIQSNGQRIEFLSNIAEIKALQKLIQTRATNATTTQWLHPHGEEDDLFGGAASLYADGIVGAGPKTHHYRTRTTRAMITLGFVMLIPLIVSLFTGTRNGLPADKSDDWMLLFFGTCVGLPTLGALLAFRFSWLRPEENGLRQNSIWGERFLPWHEIHKLAFNGHYYIVAGQNRIIRFGAVADCEGLLAEIERRTGVESKRDGNAF